MMSQKELYYYDLFLNNSMRGALYRIKFKDGTTLTGVPTAGSMQDPNDPNPTFFLELKNSKRPILLRDIKEAKKIE